MARAEQLREAIAALPISTAQGSLSVTVSVGVIIAQGAGLATSKDVLREADVALYAAKAAGRNRCWLAEPDRPGNFESQ
jgi:diguanylate cyclase (GGDEF)-like protein